MKPAKSSLTVLSPRSVVVVLFAGVLVSTLLLAGRAARTPDGQVSEPGVDFLPGEVIVAFSPSHMPLEGDVSLAVDPVVLAMNDLPGRLGRVEFPPSYAELAVYDLVILLDAGADAMKPERFATIERFVRERGGALLVLGPPRAFDLSSTAITSAANCPGAREL